MFTRNTGTACHDRDTRPVRASWAVVGACDRHAFTRSGRGSGLSAVANLAFIGAYRVWGVIIIAVDVLVIYALAVHGREVQSV